MGILFLRQKAASPIQAINMPVTIQCSNPQCLNKVTVGDSIVGRNVKCRKCGTAFLASPTIDGRYGRTATTSRGDESGVFVNFPIDFGRYRIERLLGKGGMGAVYLAVDSQLNRQVALKIPFFNAHEDPKKLERFLREARSAARLHHPNICTIHDAGEHQGRPYITMAFIAGKPLEDLFDVDSLLPVERCVEIIRRMALALQKAHELNIVHRDLKPANVMITPDDEPVIMDFGLAKFVGETDAAEVRLTQDGALLGTPKYMAPEQVNGQLNTIGPQTDVYALGVILFELLTGQPPYSGPMLQLLSQIASAPVPRVRDLRPEIHEVLDAVCQKAMAKQPADRFNSAKEFAAALSTLDQQPAPPVIDTRSKFEQATRSSRGRRPGTTTNARQNIGNGQNRAAKRVSLPNWVWLLSGVVGLVLALGLLISQYSGTPGDREQDIGIRTPASDSSASPAEPNASTELTSSRSATESAASENQLALLQGDWEIVEEEFKGVRTSNEEIQQSQKRLHVSGNDFNILRTFSDGSEGAFRGQIRLDDGNSPKRFDWAGTEPGGKATEMLGLYEIQGDILRIVYNFQDQNTRSLRPQRFASSGSGAGVVVSTFRRRNMETSTTESQSPIKPDPAASEQSSSSIALFNGKDLTGWKSHGGGTWTWTNQELVATPSADGTPGFLMTDADYENIDIQFEVFLNSGTNSGVFLRADPAGNFSGAGQIEVQLIDDQYPQFRDAPFKTGALHGTFPSEADPAVKVGEWNSVRVRFEGRQLEVWVNRRQILNRNLDTAREQFAERPWLARTNGRIGLQISGNAEVRFRHVRMQNLSSNSRVALDGDQPQVLFNGVDLTGWTVDGNTNHWKVIGDELQISEMALSRRGMLRTVAEFTDFRLSFEARMSKDTDAGIVVRQPESRKALKINLLTGTPNQFNEGTGSLWWPDENGGTGGKKAPIRRLDLVPDSWHRFEIEVSGSLITVRIDDTEVQHADIASFPNASTIQHRKGFIGLQSSSKTLLTFRKMYLTSLSPDASKQVLQKLQGRWRSVSQARGGSRLPVAEVMAEDKVLVITGDRFTLSYYLVNDRSQRGVEEGRILSINSDTTPAEIDMIFDTRKPEPLLFKGIFELTENGLQHCYRKCPVNDSNCSRPADFSTQKGEAVFSAKYVREAD